MAAITTRETSGGSATVKGSPLTNAELDTNFINLNLGLTTTAAITGGTINNTTIGATTATTGRFTTLALTGNVISNLTFTDNTYDIGASGATRPRTIYAATSVITPLLTVNGADVNTTISPTGTGTVTINPAGASTINNTSIGATTASTGRFTTLALTGNVISNLTFTDNTYDIGASGATRPRNLYIAGNAVVGGDLAVNGATSADITTTTTTASLFDTTATTVNIGSAATAISIGNTAHTGTTTIQHDLYVSGTITFGSGASTLSATTIQIDDTLISLADNNTADILDIGFYAGYQPASTAVHTGFVRDASDSVWKLFSNVSTQPTTTVDFTSATYDALRIGALTATGLTVNGTSVNTSISPTGTGTVTINPAGAISITGSAGLTLGTAGQTTTMNGNISAAASNQTVALSPTGTGTVTINPAGAISITGSVGLTLGTAGQTTTMNGNISVTASNQTVTLSPTGTGTVAISPAGALTINPTAASTINNASIGATTASTGRFTTLALTAATNVLSDLTFTDATYDIGKSGATRPRDLFTSRDVTVGGTITVNGGSGGAAVLLKSGGDLQLFTSDNAGNVSVYCDANGVLSSNSATVLLSSGGATLTGGVRFTPYNLGNTSAATITPNALNGNYQYATNNGTPTAFNAPTADCAIDILLSNTSGATAFSFTGYTVVSTSYGDALTTSTTARFIISIRRINSIATYNIKQIAL